MQVAKAEGGIVAVCGTSVDANRLKHAAELGADLTIDVEQEDAVEVIKAHTDGYGADVVLECSGAAPAAPLGIENSLVSVGSIRRWLVRQPDQHRF